MTFVQLLLLLFQSLLLLPLCVHFSRCCWNKVLCVPAKLLSQVGPATRISASFSSVVSVCLSAFDLWQIATNRRSSICNTRIMSLLALLVLLVGLARLLRLAPPGTACRKTSCNRDYGCMFPYQLGRWLAVHVTTFVVVLAFPSGQQLHFPTTNTTKCCDQSLSKSNNHQLIIIHTNKL